MRTKVRSLSILNDTKRKIIIMGNNFSSNRIDSSHIIGHLVKTDTRKGLFYGLYPLHWSVKHLKTHSKYSYRMAVVSNHPEPFKEMENYLYIKKDIFADWIVGSYKKFFFFFLILIRLFFTFLLLFPQ